jgi:uncharacterized glyoxalase superfamily protein PhnB
MAAKKTAKKSAAKKAAPAKKSAAKKAAPAKKSAAKKAAPAKKSAAKKSAAKRAAPARKSAAKKTGVPAGFHALTASLVYKDAGAAIAWYVKALGAAEVSRMPGPLGQGVMHAEIRIGDSMMYLSDESPMSSTVAPSGPRTATASMQLFVADADAAFEAAVDAGGTVAMPVADMFWGDRMGVLVDPFGHTWMISTRVKEMTQAEMAAAAQVFFAKWAAEHPAPAAQG